MKKLVFILNAIELLSQLLDGKRVEGVLYFDKGTGRLTFKAYQRHRRQSQERVVCLLENGWLKETPQRYKFYNSVKKSLGHRIVDVVMHRELNTAMQTLEIEELIDNV